MKLGSIPSVSLPSGVTCVSCECQSKCYARKIERLRPSVAAAYKRNLDVFNNNPDTYWREIEATIMLSRFFRYHVSGDIVNDEYLEKMVEIAERNIHCEMLCFTKKYSIVNRFLSRFGAFPTNLHIILSAWRGLEMVNPYYLPTAHVIYKDGTTTAGSNAIECIWNCSECARTDGGCWSLSYGEQVVFHEH